MQNFRQFLGLDLLELLAAGLQHLESLHDGLRHAPVGFLGTAHDGKTLPGGDALVAVGVVEAQAEQSGDGRGLWLLFLFAHAVTVLGFVAVSSGISSSTAEQAMSEKASS